MAKGEGPNAEQTSAGAQPMQQGSVIPMSEQSLFQTMTQGVVYQNATGEIISANPAAERILGISLEQLRGRTSSDKRWQAIHEDGSAWPGEQHPSMQALRTGKAVTGAVMGIFQPVHNERRWIRVSAVPQFDVGETVPSLVYTIFDDITESKRIEEMLVIQRDLVVALGSTTDLLQGLTQILEAATRIEGFDCGGIYLVDDRTGALDLVAHRGLSEAFVASVSHFEATAPQARVVRAGKAVFTRYASMVAQETGPRASEGLLSLAVVPVLHEGRVVAAVNIGSHTTCEIPPSARAGIEGISTLAGSVLMRLRAEQARAESEQVFATAFRSSPVAMSLSTLEDGRFLDINEEFLRVLEREREEVLGRTSEELKLWPESQTRVEAIGAGQVRGQELRLRTRSGKVVTLLWSADTVTLGGRRCLLASGHEITARLEAEAARREMEQRMLHLQKFESLGVLAGGIAHDFNNLLMAVLGNAELALEDLSSGSPIRRNLTDIQKAAQRAADLCQQMLAYSGRGAFVLERVALGSLLSEMSDLLRATISKKATLEVRVEDGLPTIRADTTQIRQVLMNLLTNASEALGDASGVITVTCSTAECSAEFLADASFGTILEAGRYVCLEVADTGVGMAPEVLARIFEPFFSTKFLGRGLGVPAVLGILRGHKGAIKVCSEVASGTTFKLFFPVADRDQSVQEATARSSWRGSGHALLVDDEDTVLLVGKSMLERLGFQVTTAVHGREALSLFRSQRAAFDLVLLDLTMPEMDGGEAFQELRRLDPKVRVILTSGFAERDIASRFAGQGLAGFMQKPFSLGELSAKLQEVLAGGSSAQ